LQEQAMHTKKNWLQIMIKWRNLKLLLKTCFYSNMMKD